MTGEPVPLIADRYERMLKRAVRSKSYPAEDLLVLQAAALEIAELEYVMTSGWPVWTAQQVIDRMGQAHA